MRGPIDYIVVEFQGNKFKGEVLNALKKAMDNGTIDVLDIALLMKDSNGNVETMELKNIDNPIVDELSDKQFYPNGMIQNDDVQEIAGLMDDNSSVGLLIIEQLWAKDLKQALINANGKLIAEGRIHPEAEKQLANV